MSLTLNTLFDNAHTYIDWQAKPVDDHLLQQVHDHMRYGPTSANCAPLRIVFVKSPDEKAKLKPLLMEGNVDKTMKAPVVALFAHDLRFYDHLPKLFPHTDAKSWFVGNDALIKETAFRNGTLQAAYFMIVARALGLDCGPMSGFDAGGVNKAFFANTPYQVNFICNLGYGKEGGYHPRAPRFAFSDTCQIV